MVEVGLEEREEGEEEEEWRGRAATTRGGGGSLPLPLYCLLGGEKASGGGLSGMKFDYPRKTQKL